MDKKVNMDVMKTAKLVAFGTQSPQDQLKSLRATYPNFIYPEHDSKIIRQDGSSRYYKSILSGLYAKCPNFVGNAEIKCSYKSDFLIALKECFYKLIPVKLTNMLGLNYETKNQPDGTFLLFALTSFIWDEHSFSKLVTEFKQSRALSKLKMHTADNDGTRISEERDDLCTKLFVNNDGTLVNKVKGRFNVFQALCFRILNMGYNADQYIDKKKALGENFHIKGPMTNAIEITTPPELKPIVFYCNELSKVEELSCNMRSVIIDHSLKINKNNNHCPEFKLFIRLYTLEDSFMNTMVNMAINLNKLKKKDQINK